jgi:hypothetical protein
MNTKGDLRAQHQSVFWAKLTATDTNHPLLNQKQKSTP